MAAQRGLWAICPSTFREKLFLHRTRLDSENGPYAHPIQGAGMYCKVRFINPHAIHMSLLTFISLGRPASCEEYLRRTAMMNGSREPLCAMRSEHILYGFFVYVTTTC